MYAASTQQDWLFAGHTPVLNFSEKYAAGVRGQYTAESSQKVCSRIVHEQYAAETHADS